MSNLILLLLPCGTAILSLLLKSWRASKLVNPAQLPYPPGPKPLPIVGNLFDLIQGNIWNKFDDWAKQYGELVHLNIFGRHFLFVNSHRVANELFNKRSANYSGREHLTMISDLMGWDWAFGHMPYGEQWKTSRKMFHKEFQSSSIVNQYDNYLRAAHRLLRHTLENPAEFVDHLKFHAGSTIMKVVYDIDSKTQDDPYITTAESALESMAVAAEPGRFLVDIFPILRFVPHWVLGAGIQKLAREWRKTVMKMRDAPFEKTKEAMRSGAITPCFVSTLLNEVENSKRDTATKEMEIEVIRG